MNPGNKNRTRIKTVMAAENITLKNIVEKINSRNPEHTTTAQNITNKLARNTIRFGEVEEIMDILGYDVIFRHRQTGKEF